jgi:hypothetical protein
MGYPARPRGAAQGKSMTIFNVATHLRATQLISVSDTYPVLVEVLMKFNT